MTSVMSGPLEDDTLLLTLRQFDRLNFQHQVIHFFHLSVLLKKSGWHGWKPHTSRSACQTYNWGQIISKYKISEKFPWDGKPRHTGIKPMIPASPTPDSYNLNQPPLRGQNTPASLYEGISWEMQAVSTNRYWSNCQTLHLAPMVAQMGKNLPATPETQVWSLGQENPLEKGMAIPLLGSSMDRGGLQSMGSLRVGHDWVTKTFTFHSSQQVKN